MHALQIVHRPEVFVVPSAAFGMGSTSRAIIAHVPNADASFSSLYVEEPTSRKVSNQPLCAPSIQCCWQCCLCCSLLKVSRLHSRLQAICGTKGVLHFRRQSRTSLRMANAAGSVQSVYLVVVCAGPTFKGLSDLIAGRSRAVHFRGCLAHSKRRQDRKCTSRGQSWCSLSLSAPRRRGAEQNPRFLGLSCCFHSVRRRQGDLKVVRDSAHFEAR